jgi:predicted dehydrogenase
MAEQVRIGLIGCGGIGQYLVERVVGIPRARLVAVADENVPAAKKLAEKHSARACPTAQALLDMAEVDAVIVGVPQFAHKQVVLAATARRKHIFCEKPMALTVADCDEMIRAADAAGVKFMVGQVLRLIAPYAKAKLLIETEKLGVPRAIHITRLGEGFSETFNKGWRAKRELSGGLLLEVHVHEIDFMRYVCGEVEAVTAQATKVFKQAMEYEDLWHVQLQFRNGAIGLLRAGLSTLLSEHHFTIQCDGGTITTHTRKGGLTFRKPGGEPTVIEDDELNKMEDGFRWELRSWVEAILDGTPMIVTAPDGRQAVAIAEAAIEAARTGQPVRV